MRNFFNKYTDKIKECLNKSISFNPWVIGITVAVFIIAACVSYNIGSAYKLNRLVEQAAQTAVDEIKKSDSDLTSEIEKLSAQKNELNTTLSSKTDIQNAMREYETNKTEYTNQISQLNTGIQSLDTSIQQKQTELDEKKAAKAEELRIAAEKAAIEAEAQRQASMVWIGDTGTKYHRKDCRTLRGNKYQITLDEAKAQGRTACKVCGG